MYGLVLSKKPDFKIIDKNKLCISRGPSLVSWFLLFLSVTVSFQIFRRLTGNIYLTIVSVLGEILFGLDILGDWGELCLDKSEKKATISRSTWSEKLTLAASTRKKIEMRLDEICHVGVSMNMGLFVLCRDGKIIRLDTRGLNRQEIQNCRLEINRFLNTPERDGDENNITKNHFNSEARRYFTKYNYPGDKISLTSLRTNGHESLVKKHFLDRSSSVSRFDNDPETQNATRKNSKRRRFTERYLVEDVAF